MLMCMGPVFTATYLGGLCLREGFLELLHCLLGVLGEPHGVLFQLYGVPVLPVPVEVRPDSGHEAEHLPGKLLPRLDALLDVEAVVHAVLDGLAPYVPCSIEDVDQQGGPALLGLAVILVLSAVEGERQDAFLELLCSSLVKSFRD